MADDRKPATLVRGLRWLIPMVLTLVGGAALGVATGAVPGPDGVIHACYSNAPTYPSGTLRVAGDSGTCHSGETPLSWNQQGPQGDRGPQGPKGDTGAPGPQGPPGPSDVYRQASASGSDDIPIPDSDETTLHSFSVPAGSYLVEAQLAAANVTTFADDGVTCEIVSSTGASDAFSEALGRGEFASLSGSLTFTSAGAATVDLRCIADTGAAIVHRIGSSLTAIKVGQVVAR